MNKLATNHTTRQITHHRIEDEDTIYKKYELGKKLGQVSCHRVALSKKINQFLFTYT